MNNNISLAPLILMVYKRVQHTKQVLKALSENYLAKESILFVFCDAPKDESEISAVNGVRQIVIDYKKQNCFKGFEYKFQQTNKGLANSIIESVNQIINQYGSVIVLEDDLVTSKDFLNFMNDSLDFYKNNKRVWSISGYSFNMNELNSYSHDVFSTYRGCSWGWATWNDRWNLVDWHVKDYKSFQVNPILRHAFSVSGNDMPGMLDSQMKGFINSWAIRWCYQQNKLKMITIYPKFSKVRNIGLDGSGTHSSSTNKFDVQLRDEIPIFLENVIPDIKILKEFRSKYDETKWTRLKKYVKHNILNRK